MIAEARIALSKVNLNEVLVMPDSVSRYSACLKQFADVKSKADGDQMATEARDALASGYGPSSTEKSFVFHEGMAVIPVHGVLLNRFSSCWGFVTGYNFIRAQMNAAEADDDVKMIVFDVDSPGGDAAGCFELTAEIRALKTPTLAVVDDTAASGGYAIPAACKKMVASPSSTIGSIGVYRLHVDVSGADAQMGVKYDFVFSGEHKVDGHPHAPLSDEVRADWQESVDKRWEEFIADVALSRDLDPEDVRNTQARVYRADEALALGLLDAVSTPAQAVSAFVAELAEDTPLDDEEDAMAVDLNAPEVVAAIEAAKRDAVAGQPDAAKIAADAVKADRDRRTAITALDEAKERPKLAATLADTDGMTAETAKVILTSAAVETKAPVKTQSAVEKAMDQAGGAGVGLEDGEVDPAGNPPAAKGAGILAFVPKNRRVEGK